MITLDDITNENNKKYNKKWPYILDQEKKNALLNVTNKQNV